jgi:hypothetical protein
MSTYTRLADEPSLEDIKALFATNTDDASMVLRQIDCPFEGERYTISMVDDHGVVTTNLSGVYVQEHTIADAEDLIVRLIMSRLPLRDHKRQTLLSQIETRSRPAQGITDPTIATLKCPISGSDYIFRKNGRSGFNVMGPGLSQTASSLAEVQMMAVDYIIETANNLERSLKAFQCAVTDHARQSHAHPLAKAS